MLRPNLIGVSGFARSGKDTACKIFQTKLKERLGIDLDIVSFAKQIKQDCDQLLTTNLSISAFTEVPSEKELIRPLLVEYAELMKQKFGDTVWLDKAFQNGSRGIIPDVRFPIEADTIKKLGGIVVYIDKVGVLPANKLEEKNDKAMRDRADHIIRWPHYGDLSMCEKDVDECLDNICVYDFPMAK